MNNRKSFASADIVLFAGVLTIMLTLVVGYAWIPGRPAELPVAPEQTQTQLADWIERPPLAQYKTPGQPLKAAQNNNVEWSSEEIEVAYTDYPDQNYSGKFRAEKTTAPAFDDDAIFSPRDSTAGSSGLSEGPGSESGEDGPFDFASISELPPIETATENTDGTDIFSSNAVSKSVKPELPPLETGNPGWWMEEIQAPMLADRSQVKTSLDDIIFVAMQNAPQIKILNLQPALQELNSTSGSHCSWTDLVETRWNSAGNSADMQLVFDFCSPPPRGPGSRSGKVMLAKLNQQRVSDRTLQELQSYLVEVVDGYWKVYVCRATLAQHRRALARAGSLVELLTKRADIQENIDQLKRAEAATAARHSDVIRSEFELVNAQDRLINLTVGPGSQDADCLELLTEPLMMGCCIDVCIPHQTQLALQNRPEIMQAIADIRSATINEDVADSDLVSRLTTVLSRSTDNGKGRDNRPEVNRAQLQSEIFQQQFEKTIGNVVLESRIASRNLQRLNLEVAGNMIAMQKASEELDLIRQRLNVNLDLPRAGSFHIEDMLASQARLTQAELRLVQSQADQALAMVELKRATGQLLRAGDRTILAEQAAAIPVNVGPELHLVEQTSFEQKTGFRRPRRDR